MKTHIATGTMGGVYGTLLGSLFFVYFGTVVGLNALHFGIMGGLSQWVIAAQPLGARLTERFGRRKPFWVLTTLASRLLRTTGILLAWLAWRRGSPVAVPIFITGAVGSSLLSSIAEPAWLSWLADIIPERDHGKFWGRRSAWISAAVVVVLVAASVIADLVPLPSKPDVLLGIFLLGGLVGAVDIVIHGSIPEPPPHKPQEPHLVRQLAQPFRDRKFRPWLVFTCAWAFSMALGGALSELYFVDHMGIKGNFLGGSLAMNTVALLGSVVTGRWSGRLVDGLGVTRVLRLGHLGWSTIPLFWVWATPASAIPALVGSNLVGGVFATAATTASSKLVTRLPPPSARTMYIAVSTSLTGIAAGVGAMAAGAAVRGTEGIAGAVGAFVALFVVSAALRIASTLILVPRIRRAAGPL